jgi:hypothetical protein
MGDMQRRNLADVAAGDDSSGDYVLPGLPEISWRDEDEYWRDNYSTRSYAIADRGYSFYRTAYQYGVEACLKQHGLFWDDHVESELARGWQRARGESSATWEQVRPAVKDAWERACGRQVS